ncbi:hypothetical protein WJX81_007355 [Elliptochloris bilobata]|uniref:fructose-bisphosphatase n=1 Tax=Elliptochloris bilobata TaxID=381761 RepID=A0AAW1SHP5_9CHLO
MFDAFQVAVKRIAVLLARAGIDELYGSAKGAAGSAERDEPKQLDVVANDVLQAALRRCGHITAMASEEDDAVIVLDDRSGGRGPPGYVAVFDPLDGSRNIDASIPTGTIFGLYRSSGAAGA